MSSQFFYAFMAFFAIMNPISNLPAYMALVADDSQKISRKIAFRSLLIAFVIITVFIFSGDFIFKVFGITIVSFRIAGGILVAVIGYHMINGNHSPSYKGMEQQAVNSDPMSIAISPLAMPLFAGPGTITTALSLANGGLQNQLITVVAFALLCVITKCKTNCRLLGRKFDENYNENDGTFTILHRYTDDYRQCADLD